MTSDKSNVQFRVKAFVILLIVSVLMICSICMPAEASLLFEASLCDGDYGAGTAIDTMNPNHGGSPHVLGIVNESNGVNFTSTESTNRSNALINWVIGNNRISFKNNGTVSFLFKADREMHISGSIFGDNYGFDKFRHGQGCFGANAIRITNGEGIEDDQVKLTWSSWHNAVWYFPYNTSNRLEYDRWYQICYSWGGPEHDFEIWADGELVSGEDLPEGVNLPWGQETVWCPSGINFGLGDNHERGYDVYGSAAGVTFADIQIWDEYRSCANPTYDILAGWNLIGWCSDEALLGEESVVGDPLGVIPANSLISVYRYDTASGLFEKCDHFNDWGWDQASGSEEFLQLEPDRGYWVMAINDCNWQE